ncbi:MAG TPA: putative Ig domain-containing protein [Gemmataceae bacterium]|nr:putative Ig domain-containing protein [Gemmataceae bacterium]
MPAALKLLTAALPADTIQVAYNQTISANSGSATLTVTNVTNAIPGINLPINGTGSLTITGTPTAAGTETFTVTASESGQNTSVTYALVVNPALNLGSTSLPGGSTHVGYSQKISAGGASKIAYASQVVNYTPGTLADSTYNNPQAALGGLNAVTGSYTGTTYYLTPFDSAFSNSDLVEIGAGGSLVLKLARTVSTNGYTIGVHTGFGLMDVSYPDGQNSDPAGYFSAWQRSADVQVSADGQAWVDLGTVTFNSPSNYAAGPATGPEGLAPGVGPLADPGKPFLGGLSSFSGLNWQNTLANLSGSAGGTWLNLSGLTDPGGHPLTAVNFIKFSVPMTPPGDPNTGNPELMMVDAVVGLSDAPAGGTGKITLKTQVQTSVPGLIIPASATGSFAITGVPKVSGIETFSVTATDSVGATTTENYSINVEATQPLQLAPAALKAATTGQAYDVQLLATGGSGTGYTFTAAGLPAGLSLSSTGELIGTPTTASGSPFKVAFTVTDSDGVARTFTRTLIVKPAPGTTTIALPVATVGNAYHKQLQIPGSTTKGASYVSADLPSWLTLSTAGLLTGTPATPTFEPLKFTVTVENAAHVTIAMRTYALTIDPALLIISGPLPDVTVGKPYSVQFAPVGGSGNGYVFKAKSLPPGLTLSRNGLLHGRLKAVTGLPAAFSITITLTDNRGGTVTYSMPLAVTTV